MSKNVTENMPTCVFALNKIYLMMFAYDFFFWLDYLKTFLVKTIHFPTRFPLENCQYKHVFVTYCSVTKIGTE